MLTLLIRKSSYNKVIYTQDDFDQLSIEENDRILLKDAFKGSINIDKSNVKIIGGGIRGSENISGFTDNHDGTFSKTTSDPKWIINNGSMMKMSETDWINVLYSTGNTLTISHSDVSSYSSIVGSILIVKDRPWRVGKYLVTAYNGAGVITVDRTISPAWAYNFGSLKLLNKKDYFSGDNEWAYDGVDLIIKASSEPTGIKSIINNVGITVSSNNAIIDNVDISEFFGAGIEQASGDYMSISNCNVSMIKDSAILARVVSENLTITNNRIENIGFDGVESWAKRYNISHNQFNNIGMFDNYGFGEYSGVYSTCAIGCSSYTLDGLIEYNILNNMSYCGLRLATNNLVKRNVVTNAMQRFVDGAGIYTFGGNANSPAIFGAVNTIIENFVTGCIGNSEGAATANTRGYGIYLDDASINSTVANNTVYKNGVNFFVKGHDNSYRFNKILKGIYGNFEFIHASGNPINYNIGNICEGNVICTDIANIQCIKTTLGLSDPSYNPYSQGGFADNNYFINPFGTLILLDHNAGSQTLSQMQNLYENDANSIEHTNYITAPGDPDNEILLITNPTDSEINGSAPIGNWYDIDSNLVTNYTVQAWGSLVLLKNLI